MRFKSLKIYELVTDNDYELTHTFSNVSVTLTLNTSQVFVKHVTVAVIRTFDHNPIIIADTSITISGVLERPEPSTKDGFGRWELA